MNSYLWNYEEYTQFLLCISTFMLQSLSLYDADSFPKQVGAQNSPGYCVFLIQLSWMMDVAT